ncbi:MAG: hypothetical protein KF729_01315 [Sandaracinaceae bacterium]|nr:hypothetical protein [Sandaracinaceae bacterium]
MRRAPLALALLALACDGAPSPVDSGRADAGTIAPRDAGTDAGTDADTDAGADAGADAGTDAGPAGCVGPPGLYVAGSCTELAEGVQPFHPRFELWSDGDDKERFVYLPPGTRIDTSDPDRWGFPRGTRLYKTFSIGGVRLETRLLEKTGTGRGRDAWTMVAYAWSADQRSVTEVGPFGEQNVLGTEHDIPTRAACVRCHTIAQDDAINGFSAIQLAHDEGGVTLASLSAEGWLTHPIPLADATVPGDSTARAALGYLHANCGSCHGGPAPEHGLDLWLRVGTRTVETSSAWTTAVCGCSVWTGTGPAGEVIDLRIAPGHPERSVIPLRMGSRAPTDAMPPLASERVDPEGLRVIEAWIATLDETANGCPHGCPWP